MGCTGIYACGESVSHHDASVSEVLFSLKQEAPASIGGSTFTIAANSIPESNKTIYINKQGKCLYFVFTIGSMMAKVRVLNNLDDDGDFTEFVNAKFMNNIFSFMHDMNIKGTKWTIKKYLLNTFVSGELDFAMSGIRVGEEVEKKYTEVF